MMTPLVLFSADEVFRQNIKKYFNLYYDWYIASVTLVSIKGFSFAYSMFLNMYLQVSLTGSPPITYLFYTIQMCCVVISICLSLLNDYPGYYTYVELW